MIQRLLNSYRKKPKRIFKLLQIEPTLQCNLACLMCPWTALRSNSGCMDKDTFDRIRPYLQQAEAVDFTGGGEPLGSPLLLDMIQAAKQAGCSVGFSTNGSALSGQVAEKLVMLDLDWISFSIDAATPELYNRIRQGADFERVTANIRALAAIKMRLRKRTPRLMMVFVMMAGSETNNYQQLPDYINLAHSLGVEVVIAKNLDVILKDEDDQRRLFRHDSSYLPDAPQVLAEAARRASQLGISLRTYRLEPREQTICEHDPLHNVYINWQGYISPCISLSYAENRVFDGARVLAPCQRFGNVHDEALPAIWNRAEYVSFRQRFIQRINAASRGLIAAYLNENLDEAIVLPEAPEGCRTCYYLYGI